MITFNLGTFCDSGDGSITVSDVFNSNISGDLFIAELYIGSSATGTPIQSYSPVTSGNGPQYIFMGLSSGTYTVRLISQGDGTTGTNTVVVPICCDIDASSTTITPTSASDCSTADGQIAVSYSGGLTAEARIFRNDTSSYSSWQTLPHTFSGLNDGAYTVEIRDENNSGCNYDEDTYVGPACCINTPTINVQDAVNSQPTGYIQISHNQSGYEYGTSASGGVIGDVSNWTTKKYITGLAAGNYLLWVRKVSDNSCNSSFAFTINNDLCSDYSLSVTVFSTSNETGPNLNDGSVSLSRINNYPQLDALGNVFYPSTYTLTGQMSIGPQGSFFFNNLEPGNYTATITNAGGCASTVDFTIESGDVVLSPVAYIPKLNSIRFVNEVPADYVENFNDEVLNQNQYFEGKVKPFCYEQLYLKGEMLKVQLRTNYENNFLQIKTSSGSNFNSPIASDLKTNNIGLIDTQDVNILYDDGSSIFVQFQSQDMPDWVKVGQVITISGAGAIDDNYTITEFSNLGIDGLPYVKVNYSSVFFADTTGTLTTTYNAFPYNIHEFTFSIPANGVYYLEVYGSDPDYSNYLWKSELIRITDNENILRNNVLITWKNSENDFGIDYSTGYEGKMRVYGRFFLPAPAGEDDLTRDSGDDWITIQSYKRARRLLEVLQVPRWAAEKLNFIIGHDTIYVNGLMVKTDENVSINALGKSQYINCEVNLEILNYIDG